MGFDANRVTESILVAEPPDKSVDSKTTFEKHYSIHEIATLWGLSVKTVRRLFDNEPGVIELANPETRFKRAYVTRRVPESVLLRVHRKLRRSA
jgi:hypothetical protein